jgi:NhaP-type Na+/H+ or K+/H+ antiporter
LIVALLLGATLASTDPATLVPIFRQVHIRDRVAHSVMSDLLRGMKAPGAQMIASITLIAILMTILIQAPTTEWLGRRLGFLKTR